MHPLGLIPNRATAVEDHNRPKRDEEIQSFKVHLVDPESNKLTQPYLLTQVLNSLEKDAKGRREQYLQEVGPMDRMADPPRWFPICKVFNKQKDREKELALKKAARLRKQTTKQLEFSWIMSDNDLDHRLGRLTEFLRKGFRVELLFGVKRKGWVKKRQATSEDIHKVLARTRGAVSEVDGAKEFHAIQREEGGEATWTFEGKKQDRSSQQGQSERDASIGDVKEEKT
ncbi:hypothetical protein MMC21_002885 [Puttea exsequens]|nr:hypothetical protein [Puttea exsequens]